MSKPYRHLFSFSSISFITFNYFANVEFDAFEDSTISKEKWGTTCFNSYVDNLPMPSYTNLNPKT